IRENNELRQQLLRNQEEWTSKQTEYENKIRLLDDQISELNFTKQRLIQQNQSNEKDIDQLKNHINSILSKENVWIENGELKKQQISISKLLTTSHDSIISSDNQVRNSIDILKLTEEKNQKLQSELELQTVKNLNLERKINELQSKLTIRDQEIKRLNEIIENINIEKSKEEKEIIEKTNDELKEKYKNLEQTLNTIKIEKDKI